MSIYYKIIAFILIVGGAYTYFDYTQDTIQKLTAENTTYKNAVKAKDSYIISLEQTAEKSAKEIQKLNEDLKKDEKYINDLQKILRKHDLTNLASKKPKLIERRINDATQKVFDAITSDSNF